MEGKEKKGGVKRVKERERKEKVEEQRQMYVKNIYVYIFSNSHSCNSYVTSFR